LFVQADLMALPFAAGAFDLAFSFGVLHHLPDPEAGFKKLVALVRPGGRVLVYLYHALEGEPIKQAILRAVTAVRRVTVRMPHRALLPATTALGWALYAGVVTPYKILSRFEATRPLAEKMPLRIYADYPVRVIVNDQFDRFSAPIENRYRKDEVAGWLERAGLGDIVIHAGYGWRAVGTVVSKR
jgi:SAM-dependent methyltransferase